MRRGFFRFCVFTRRGARPTTSGGCVLRFTYLPGALRDRRPSGTPSFAARRKIEEKGVPRGCGPLNPRGNVLGHSDVLCANHFATVHLTRLSRAWRAPHCFHALCVLRVPWKIEALSQPPNFRPQIRLVILSVPTFFAAFGAVSMSPWKQCEARHGRA